MFGFFSKKKEDFVYDQGVIVDIDFKGLIDFGTSEQQKEVRVLEKVMGQILPIQSGIDGDEFGDGTATIYLYGPSADNIFMAVSPILKKSSFEHIDITLQYGQPDDPATKEKSLLFDKFI